MATPNDKDDQPPKTPGKSSAPAGESKTPASGNTTVEYIKIEDAKGKLQSDLFDPLNAFNDYVVKSFTVEVSNAQNIADHIKDALMPMLDATCKRSRTESTDSGKTKIRLIFEIRYKRPLQDIKIPKASLTDPITLRVKRAYLFLFKKTIIAIQNSVNSDIEKANLRNLAALRMHAMITYYHELRKQASGADNAIKDDGYSDDGGDFGDGGFGDGQSVVLNDDVMDDINAAVNADDMLQAALLSVFGKLMEGMTAEKSRGALKRAFERYDKKNIDKMDAAALEGDAAPAGGGGGGGSGGGGGAAPAGGGSGGGDNLHSYLKQLRL